MLRLNSVNYVTNSKNKKALMVSCDSTVKLAKKDLLILSIIITLFTSTAYAYTLPTAYAAELNVQDKTTSILNDVLGLQTELYAISESNQRDSQHISLAQKEANVYLSSSQSTLRVRSSFVNNELHEIYLSDREGNLQLKQSANNTDEMAQGFLERFQNYTQNPFYGTLAVMLNNTNGNLNLTKPADNIQLEVTTTAQKNVDYIWTYIDANGNRADRKNVVLSFEGDQLKGFINNWPLYNITGTPKISAEEATAIAIEASKNFSYKVITENGEEEMITGFEIAPESLGHESIAYLNYNNENDARGSDPFTLYPAWYVPIGFDKFYPGDVSSMAVVVWADTGEVSAMQELVVNSGFLGTSTNESITSREIFNSFSQQALIPIAIMIALGLYFAVVKSMSSRGRLVYRRFWSVFIGISILFSALLVVSTPTVNATVPEHNSKSRIYSCEGIPPQNGYNNPDADGNETIAMAEVCNYIGNLTEDNGYSTENLHGPGTLRDDVYDNAYFDEQTYDRTTVFHVGHFYSMGISYQDSTGNEIKDNELYTNTSLGEHFFTFLWVCVQAQNGTQQSTVKEYTEDHKGTPIAWTHRDGSAGHPYMSSDGYAHPDFYGQCYISFYGYSPMLSGLPINTFFEQTGITNCKEFIKKFYDYALTDGLSVHDALDQASSDYFGVYYSSSILCTGYNCY